MRGQFYAGRPVVSARGFFGAGEAEYVLLLVDGFPISDVESGLIDWALVPMSSVRRIKAFRGPGASMYGRRDRWRYSDPDRPTKRRGPVDAHRQLVQFIHRGRLVWPARARGVNVNVSGAARHTNGAFAHSRADQFVGGASVEGGANGLTWPWTGTGERRNATIRAR